MITHNLMSAARALDTSSGALDTSSGALDTSSGANRIDSFITTIGRFLGDRKAVIVYPAHLCGVVEY